MFPFSPVLFSRCPHQRQSPCFLPEKASPSQKSLPAFTARDILFQKQKKELIMRCVTVTAAALATFLFCSLSPHTGLAGQDSVQSAPRLLKVVVLSRHGVRPPTQSPETLAAWSRRSWPDWNTAPGNLTGRGASLIQAEWSDIRQSLAFDDLLPASECPDDNSVFIYADNEERTLATAEAMLEGLAPGCGMKVTSGREKYDPVFHPVKNGLMSSPSLSDQERRTLSDELSSVQADMDRRIAELSALLGPSAAALCGPGQSPCTLSDMPTTLHFPKKGSHEPVALRGGLALASTTAEILLLESLEWPERSQSIAADIPVTMPREPGTPVEQKARQIILAPRSDKPGVMPLPFRPRWRPASVAADGDIMVNPSTAFHLLPVHTRVQGALQRFPAVARQEGLPLLLLMAEALAGTSPFPDANRAKLVVFSGHDTNIVNIAGLLDLHWTNTPFPKDSTPPGSMLVFRLWETPQGNMVQASFQCQTPAAFLSTDTAVMSSASLRRQALILPGSFAETPAGPGLPLHTFLSSVRTMAGEKLDARLNAVLAPAP